MIYANPNCKTDGIYVPDNFEGPPDLRFFEQQRNSWMNLMISIPEFPNIEQDNRIYLVPFIDMEY